MSYTVVLLAAIRSQSNNMMAVKAISIATLLLSTLSVQLNGQSASEAPDHSVAATYHDLQSVKRRAAFNRIQQQYYDAAMLHLQKLNERTAKGGKIEKPELEEIIQDVQFVVNHDPIQESGRVRLIRDISQLRILRDQL